MIKIQLEGMKELADNLVKFPERFARRALARSVRDGAVIVRDRAREYAESFRDTGTLIKSISIRRVRTRNWRTTAINGIYHSSKPYKVKAVKLGLKRIAPYGKFYEVGFKNETGGRTQRPHLRPAIDNHAPEIIEAIKKRMKTEIDLLAKQFKK